jgi:large subunit ribosomal protein L25
MATAPIFDLEATDRSDLGKGASRRLRRLEDLVPGIIYGGSKKPHSISLPHRVVRKALENEAFYSHILTLTVAGHTEKVILKDMQRHPYKPIIQHMDFQRVDMNKPLHIHVPIHFINEKTAPGVQAGGQVSHSLSDLEITCLPADLPEFIEVDLANMQLDEIIYLSNLALPKGVTPTAFTHGATNDIPVVSIHMPKIMVEEEPEVEASEEAAAPAPEAEDETKKSK